MTSNHLRCRILLSIVALPVLVFGPAAYADAPFTDIDVNTGLVLCGGLGERPCDLISEFFLSNLGQCDRGLKIDGPTNSCVNFSRRTEAGRAFAKTWLGRALRMQRQDLNWTISTGRLSLPSAHNAFNNVADGYTTLPVNLTNQFFSMTDLLDAGIRVFEWDVHRGIGLPDGPTGSVPELCHGTEAHAGCVRGDRDAVNIIKELRGWMREPGHENEVVFIGVENRMDIDSAKFTNAVAVFLENVDGIGVFKPGEFLTYSNALTGTFEHTTLFNDIEFGFSREWPSQQYLVKSDNRVVFLGNVSSTDIYLSGYVHNDAPVATLAGAEYIPQGHGFGTSLNVWHGDSIHKAGFPGCTIPWVVGDVVYIFHFEPLSGAFFGFYSDDLDPLVGGTADSITVDDIAQLTKCNLDHIRFDQILNPISSHSGPRLEAAVWSWVVDQPPKDAVAGTLAAWMSSNTGRWSTDPPSTHRPYLCRQQGVEPDKGTTTNFVKNIPKTTWSVTTEAGEFAGGLAACAALHVDAGDAPWKFLPPFNGYENELAEQAAFDAGADPWINFIARGNDRWGMTTSIRMQGTPPLHPNVSYGFAIQGDVGASRVLWDFGDGAIETSSDDPSFALSHSFAQPGTYTVTAILDVLDYTFTIEREVTIMPPPDTTPPVITPSVAGTLGNDGWYLADDVIVNWTIDDAESAVTSTSGCGAVHISIDTTGMTITCSATSGGGTASESVTIKRDATPPQITCGSADGLWHTDNVSIACTATGGLSGLADPAQASFSLSTSVASGDETANASTGTLTVCDVAGHCPVAGPIASNMIDRKAPEIACASPDGAWHAMDQSFACTANDGGSGLDNPADTGFSLSTSVSAGTEDASAFTNSRTVCDDLGNCSTAGPIGPVRVDKRAPQLSVCDSPDGAWHLNDVTLFCSYTDGGSGPPSQQVGLNTNIPDGAETNSAVASAGGNRACDAIGNCAATPADIPGNWVDRKDPTITLLSRLPAANGFGWNNTDVTVTWTCADGGSGPASPSISDTKTGDGQNQTANGTCHDRVGNFASDSLGAISIDKTQPTLNPAVDPNPVLLNGSATASTGAQDALSGIDTQSCGTVGTSSVGPHSVACTATDKAGNPANANANYSVIFAPAGSCLVGPGHQILQPIDLTGLSVFPKKQGGTIPVKFRVCDASGVSMGPAAVVTSFYLTGMGTGTPSPIPNEDPVSTTPDTMFRWNASDQHWIFNLSTKNLLAGYTYQYTITLTDSSTIVVQFGLK